MTEPARRLPIETAPPMRFRCLIAPSAPRVRRHGGCQSTAAFRPQVFATSRRLTPRDALRACFIPLARPGFPLQGLSHPGSRATSRWPLPSCRLPPVRLPLARATHRRPASRALLPLGVRYRRPGVTPFRWPDALLGFSLFRVFPLSAVGHASATLPSRAFPRSVRDAAALAPQGLSEPRARLGLSRDCRPS